MGAKGIKKALNMVHKRGENKNKRSAERSRLGRFRHLPAERLSHR